MNPTLKVLSMVIELVYESFRLSKELATQIINTHMSCVREQRQALEKNTWIKMSELGLKDSRENII